jgi:hypothetical protein
VPFNQVKDIFAQHFPAAAAHEAAPVADEILRNPRLADLLDVRRAVIRRPIQRRRFRRWWPGTT